MAKRTPESKVKDDFKDDVDRICKARGLRYKLTYNAGAAFGLPTLDCTGVIAGNPIAVEFKRLDGKGKLTARQKADLRDFAESGAVTWVIEDVESYATFMEYLEFQLIPAQIRRLTWRP